MTSNFKLNERVAPRTALELIVDVTTEKAGTVPAHLADLSERGCRIELPKPVTVGTWITITVPGHAALQGWAAWRDSAANGVDFAHPLPPAVANSIVQRACLAKNMT